MSNHECKYETIHSGHCWPAISKCYQDDNGILWATNGEYSNQVQFCPFCGFKGAEISMAIEMETDEEIEKIFGGSE